MGLQAGSLPLAMEVMRYTGTPYSGGCAGYVIVRRWGINIMSQA